MRGKRILIGGLLVVLALAIWYALLPGIFKEGFSSLASPWQAPDSSTIPKTVEGNQIRYGQDLIARTSYYLGPQGKIAQTSNGMNCQNCHLDAGTRPFGNNYGSVAATYPKFRARSGSMESVEKRINDCIERSLNGKSLDPQSEEMKAMIAYMMWLGKDVPKGITVYGSGLYKTDWLSRAADPDRGNALYIKHCKVCHGESGQGVTYPDSTSYLFPPAWGDNSFNTAAGQFRISKYSSFIFTNMPVGATYKNPVLTEEEAWDIAAFVLSQPRIRKDFAGDWPDLKTKPVDDPFSPYADAFSERQHKYGPFPPILNELNHK